MQVLPKIQRSPLDTLSLSSDYSMENLLSAYRAAVSKLNEKRTLETAFSADEPTLNEIEWAFKELLALKRSLEPGSRNDEEGVVSAVLLPGLNQGTVEMLGKESNNVVALSSRREFKEVSFAEGEVSEHTFPELKEILEKVARTTIELTMSQQTSTLSNSVLSPNNLSQNTGHSYLGSSIPSQGNSIPSQGNVAPPSPEPFQLSSPLSSRSFAPNLVTPKTIRTVIGGEDKPVVNTVAQKGLAKDTQAQYQHLLSSAGQARGELLRKLREAAGVDPWELSQRTRISLEHLNALETDDYDGLPAPVYYRGYVSSFLKYLGIQRDDLIDAFCEVYRVQKRNRGQRVK